MHRNIPKIPRDNRPMRRSFHAPRSMDAMESCHIVYGVASVAAMAVPQLHLAATLAAGGIAVCIIISKVTE